MLDLGLCWRIWQDQYERCRRECGDDVLAAAVTATLVAVSTARELGK